MTEEKKPMSTQKITVIVAIIMIALGGVSSIANWAFDLSDKWNDYRDSQDLRQINHYADIVSDSTIAKVTREIDPMNAAQFESFKDSLYYQIRTGKSIAFTYMNAVDSLCQIIIMKEKHVKQLQARIDMLEVELDISRAKTRDEGLQTVMNALEKVLSARDQSVKLDSMMIEIRRMNLQKLKEINSGDRAQ